MILVLIPDGESVVCPNVINCLSHIEDIKIFIMSNRKRCPVKYSRHIHNFAFYQKTDSDLDWIRNINDELNKHKIDIVMPIFTDGIEAILSHISHITWLNKLHLLPSLSDFKIAENKGMLIEHLSAINLPFPKSVLFDLSELDSLSDLNFPIIIKPLEGIGGGTGINLFYNDDELRQYLNTSKLDSKHLAQEYIYGYDVDCSVLCKSGNILACTIQKTALNNDNPFAPAVGIEFIKNESIYEIVKKLVKSLNWSGVVHVDLRFDERSNTYKIIEMNPRFWGSVDASLLAGINFPQLYCLSILNKNFGTTQYNFINFLNLKGLIKSVKKQPLYIFRFHFILNNTSFKFFINDPLPIVFNFSYRIKLYFSNMVKFKRFNDLKISLQRWICLIITYISENDFLNILN